MSLKLIRNAILATTTNPEILIAEEVKAAVKGLPLRESMHPSLEITKSDYDRWMGVVHDIARESGAVIRSKADLADIALDVLDNDPKIESQPGDKEVLKHHILNTLWNAHKATLSHVGVTKHVTKAREEEEQSGFAQSVKTVHGIEDEQVAKPAVKASNPYPAGSIRHELWAKMHPEENEEFRPEAEADVPAEDVPTDDVPVDAEVDGVAVDAEDDDAAEIDAPIQGADDVDADAELEDDEADPMEVLADLSTEELEAELERRREEEGGDEVDSEAVDAEAAEDQPESDEAGEDAEVAVDAEADVEGEAAPAKADEKKETPDDIANRITFDDEEQVKNLFRQALGSPTSDELKSAREDAFKQGQDSLKDVQFAKNPFHPKSLLYREFEKGRVNMVKAMFNIKDKPAAAAKKKKR